MSTDPRTELTRLLDALEAHLSAVYGDDEEDDLEEILDDEDDIDDDDIEYED